MTNRTDRNTLLQESINRIWFQLGKDRVKFFGTIFKFGFGLIPLDHNEKRLKTAGTGWK